MTDETRARIRTEALALRHLWTLPPEEMEAAAARLAPSIWTLVPLMRAVSRALENGGRLELPGLAAMMERPVLRSGVEALQNAGSEDALDPAKGQDPDKTAEAYQRALDDAAKAGDIRRVEAARRIMDTAEKAKTTAERRTLLEDASHELGRAGHDIEETLPEAWNAHKTELSGKRVRPEEAIMLDHGRGEWARWFNAHLGPRGGLTPGRKLMIGGPPGGGKTSLAAVLAVDAMAAGCPVTIWQLELSREEMLEHLVAQDTSRGTREGPHWKTQFWERAANGDPPAAWWPLLSIPRWPDPTAEAVEDALFKQARSATRARRTGKIRHSVNGLVIVDYAQLLTMASRGPRDAGHEILATAASRVVKATAETGAVLVLLSQVTKEAQQRQSELEASTDFANADLARMVDCAVSIYRAAEGKDGFFRAAAATEKEVFFPDQGNGRWLRWKKTRGKFLEPPDYEQPKDGMLVWYKNRAWHGDEPKPNEAKAGGNAWWPAPPATKIDFDKEG